MYLVPHVYLGEGESTKVRIGSLHCRFNSLFEDFFYKLTNIWPHLMHSLWRKKKKRKRVNALEETFLGYPRCRSIFMKPPHHTLIPCWATPLSPHLENEPETENRLNNQNVLFYVNGYFKHIPSQQVTAHHQLTVTHITAIKIVNHSIFSFFIRMTSWFFNCKACRERCIGSWGDIKEGILYQFLLARLTLVTQWTLVKKKISKNLLQLNTAPMKMCYQNMF